MNDASLFSAGNFLKGHNKSQSLFSRLSLILLPGNFDPNTNNLLPSPVSCHFPTLFADPKLSVLGYCLNNWSLLT